MGGGIRRGQVHQPQGPVGRTRRPARQSPRNRGRPGGGLHPGRGGRAAGGHVRNFPGPTGGQEEAPGTIHLYSGPFSGIKAGWALCDGLEGRPDLADKFILGTAVEEEIGQTGGEGSHTHSVSGTVTGTALTVAQMPAHDHTVTALGAAGGTSFEDGSGWSAYFGPITTSSAGSGQAHGHGLNVAAQAASNLPPYYKLAFIIKL